MYIEFETGYWTVLVFINLFCGWICYRICYRHFNWVVATWWPNGKSFQWGDHVSWMFGPILKIWQGMWFLGQHLVVAMKKEEGYSSSRKNEHILQARLQCQFISRDGGMHKNISRNMQLIFLNYSYTSLLGTKDQGVIGGFVFFMQQWFGRFSLLWFQISLTFPKSLDA